MPDIQRDPAILKRKKLRHALYAAVGVLIVIAVSIALARMEPAAPTVERATVLVDTGQTRVDRPPASGPRHSRPGRYPVASVANQRPRRAHSSPARRAR
jgi:hypothetical protein